jgi:hypothetical protein
MAGNAIDQGRGKPRRFRDLLPISHGIQKVHSLGKGSPGSPFVEIIKGGTGLFKVRF